MYQNLFLHSFCKDRISFFFLSRGYNLFMAHFKDLVLKNRIQMGKNMRMNFFKQRITIVLLLVVGVYIYIVVSMNSISLKKIIMNIC